MVQLRGEALVVAVVVAAVLCNVIGLVAIAAGPSRIDPWWTVAEEANPFTWLSSAALLLTAVALALVGQGRPWWIAPAIVLAASFDETATLHERLDLGREGDGVLRNGWIVAGVPLAIAAALLLVRWAKGVDPRLRRRLAMAGLCYITGALVVEGLTGAYESARSIDRGYWLLATVEENLELLGVVLALHAVVQFLSDRRISVRTLFDKAGGRTCGT